MTARGLVSVDVALSDKERADLRENVARWVDEGAPIIFGPYTHMAIELSDGSWVRVCHAHADPFAPASRDWACVDCRPDSPLLVEGFRCMVHEARARRAPTQPTPIDEYQRVYERSGVDPHGIYGPAACSMPGHVRGCEGKAGGDHELLPEWIAIHGEGYDVEIEMAD